MIVATRPEISGGLVHTVQQAEIPAVEDVPEMHGRFVVADLKPHRYTAIHEQPNTPRRIPCSITELPCLRISPCYRWHEFSK